MGLLVDLLILVGVGISAAIGVVTGFVWQVTGFIGLALGVVAGLGGADLFGSWLNGFLSLRAPGGEVIAFFFCLAVVGVAARVVAGVLKPRIDRWQLERHNRFWGGVAGAVKGLLLAMVIVSVLSGSARAGAALERSLLGANLAALGRLAVPEALRDSHRNSPLENGAPPAEAPEDQGTR